MCPFTHCIEYDIEDETSPSNVYCPLNIRCLNKACPYNHPTRKEVLEEKNALSHRKEKEN